jgi:hypothetical protein
MQIEGHVRGETEKQATFLMLALEPPGNLARDLALYRRALFHDSGDPSCFLLPELAPIAFAPCEPRRRTLKIEVRRAFDEAWKAAKGAFSSASAIESRGLLYLGLDGPLEALISGSPDIISDVIPRSSGYIPLEAGLGFLLCRSSPLAIESIKKHDIPRISFLDCSLALFSIRFGADPFSSASWREIARSRRPTGPRSRADLTSSSRE